MPLAQLRGSLLCVAWAAAAGCRGPTEPLPPDAVAFTPPAVYARWWAMTQACSGRTGDPAAVRWYRAPGATVPLEGETVAGYWGSHGNRVVLAEAIVANGAAVRHEMLHALLRVGGHPRTAFLGACASLVDCAGQCVADAGPWRPPDDVAALAADWVEVAARAEVLPPEADGERWLALQVTARNPRDHAVVVVVPSGSSTPATFGYDVRRPSGEGLASGRVAFDGSAVTFGPGETKRWLFEFRVGAALTETTVPPETLLVRGGYARHWAAATTVVVRP